jgi:sugar phosphate isomerase/epimerase
MSTISVSSYSLREQLGPVIIDMTDGDGKDIQFAMPFPRLVDLSEFPQRAKDQFGVTAIETVSGQFAGLDDPELGKFADALEASGVQLLNVAIDVGDLLSNNPEKRAADVVRIKRWIDTFASMGSSFVRVNPGSPFAQETEEPPQYLVESLLELSDHARSHGTRLLVENHGGRGSDPAWMHDLLDRVGRDNLGLLLDLGNFDVLMKPVIAAFTAAFTGQPLEGGIVSLLESLDLTPLYEGIEALASRAELVHVKVNDVDEVGTIRAVDLGRAFGILNAHNYSGPLTVEYEGTGGDPWQKTATVVEFVRTLTTTTAPSGR